ncbi:unnamed protein product, partial [Dovyalis caffra]
VKSGREEKNKVKRNVFNPLHHGCGPPDRPTARVQQLYLILSSLLPSSTSHD